MGDGGDVGMVAFLGVPADPRLLDEDLVNLPEAEQRREPEISTHQHDRLVAAGSVLTGVTLIGGAAMALYGGWQALFQSGGAFDGVGRQGHRSNIAPLRAQWCRRGRRSTMLSLGR